MDFGQWYAKGSAKMFGHGFEEESVGIPLPNRSSQNPYDLSRSFKSVSVIVHCTNSFFLAAH